MSRLGRSQPVQPFATHGFLGNTPANGVLPGRILVTENDDRKRRTPPLQPVIVSGALQAVPGGVAVITPPLPVVVIPFTRSWPVPAPLVVSGVLAVQPPPVSPPLPLFVSPGDRPRRIVLQPIVSHGPVPAVFTQELSLLLTGAGV